MRATLDLDEDILNAAKRLRQTCHLYTTDPEVTKRWTDRGAEADQIAETVSGRRPALQDMRPSDGEQAKKSREPEEARTAHGRQPRLQSRVVVELQGTRV